MLTLRQSTLFLLGITLLVCAPFLFSMGIVGNFGDIFQYAAPFRHFATETLQTGHMPLWNPYIFGGSPFLASPQSALFYPLTCLFYFLPLNFAFNIFTSFHLFLNAFGFYLFLRSLKFYNSTSLWGSIVWGFSSFFLSKVAAGHIIHLSGYSWFGLILLFAFSSWRNPLFSLPFFCFVLAFSLQFFSGHLQVSFHTGILLALLFLYKIIIKREEESSYKLRSQTPFISTFFLSLVSILLLVSVQLLPTLEFMGLSMRVGTSTLFDIRSAYTFATSYSMKWKDLTCLILPNFFGNPMAKNYIDPLHPSIFFETQAIYFGLLPLLMVLKGNLYLLKKKKIILPTLTLLFLVLAMGKNSFLYNWLWTIFSFLRVPARFFFLAFATALMTAVIFWEEKIAKGELKIKWIAIGITCIDLFFVTRPFIWTENSLQKLGRSQVMTVLQKNILESFNRGNANLIFTTGEIPNPNKTIFFHLQNFNGYEAILQRSYLKSFSLSQGPQNVSSTGALEVPNPNAPLFAKNGVRYLVTLTPFDRPWPLKYNDGQVRIYENPNLKAMSQELELQYQYYRPEPNKIILGLKPHPKSLAQVHLLEAFYPGWRVWNRYGEKIIPSLEKGYFQKVDYVSPSKYHKLYWRFTPINFYIGAAVSSLFLFVLALFGMRSLAYAKV